MLNVHIEKSELLAVLKTIKPLVRTDKKILAHALLSAQKPERATPATTETNAVGHRTPGIHTEAVGDHIALFATDYETTLAMHLFGSVVEAGQVLIPVHKTMAMLKDMRPGPVWIREIEHGMIAIEAGTARITLPGVDVGLYPSVMPEPQPFQWAMAGKEMRRAVELTLPATLTNDARQNLRGVHFAQSNGVASFTATDGHRLARVQKVVETGRTESEEIIVPQGALEIWKAALKLRAPDVVAINFDDRRYTFSTPGMMLSGRAIEGKFPNVEPIIPRGNHTHMESNCGVLTAALKSIAAATHEKIKPVKLSMNGKVWLQSERAEYGEVSRFVEAHTTGPDLTIGLNAAYLLDMLKTIPASAEVKGSFQGPLNPIMFQTTAEPGYFAVVMPLRIEW